MSASLVGSEMCIRDRARVVPCLREDAHGTDGALHLNDLERDPAPALPVSYTHLTLPTICSV
eukprot:8167521-Alexandrium_andersonii.AAC.1